VVAATLGVDVARVRQWAELERSEVSPVEPAGEVAPFVDVGRQLAAAALARHETAAGGVWSAVVLKPCGTSLRIQGPVDVAMVEAVVRGVCTPG
jgi:hypothetical protein